jgi:hypothetical protein
MKNLARRITALEQACPKEEPPQIIFINGGKKLGKELAHIHDHRGNHWYRLPDEIEQVFMDRVAAETPHGKNQVAMLFEMVF